MNSLLTIIEITENLGIIYYTSQLIKHLLSEIAIASAETFNQ